MILATNLTGWWVAWGVTGAVVVVVALVVLLIISTAQRIAAVAADATRSLVETRERTEVLWQVSTTNKVASDILDAATEARRALGG